MKDKRTEKIRKSIYISEERAGLIKKYALLNGISESTLYNIAIKRFCDQGILIEVIKSIQNNQ